MTHSILARFRGPLLVLLLPLASASFAAEPAPAAPSPAAAPASAAAAEATKQRFDVFEYQVEGNTALPVERIERAVYPFLGESKNIDDVEAARTALEKVYRDGGYSTVVVDIPPQKVVSGVIVLNVVEGHVSRLRVLGSRYYSQERILATVPSLAEGKVLYLPDVQKDLTEVNTTLDKRVTPLLRPGKEPGTTEVDLQVEDTLPLHGSIELNNHNAPQTSAARLVASLRYANLFQREHTLGLQLQTSPENTDEVKVAVATYSMPVAGGNTLLLSAVRSNSNSFVGGGIGVFGRGSIYGLRLYVPLPGERPANEFFQSLNWGVDYKHVDQNITLQDGSTIATPIRYLPFSIAYSGLATDGQGSTDFGAGWTFALRGLATQDAQFQDKRYRASSSFSLVKFNLGRTQSLPRGASVRLTVDAQATLSPLVSNEQYIAGGVDSVRGYLESTQTGDVALHEQLEWRSPNVAPDKARLEQLQFRTFVDGAYLRQLSPLPGTRYTWELLSVGGGLTLRARPGLVARADLAWPLRSSTFQSAYRPRLQGSATFEF